MHQAWLMSSQSSLCGVDVKPGLQKRRLRLSEVKGQAQGAKNIQIELGLESVTGIQAPHLFCYNTLPLGPCLDFLLRAKAWSIGEERDKERGKQAKKLPDWGPHYHLLFITVSPFSACPDQATKRLTFCSVSTVLQLQMFINTCYNVISSWENTCQVMDADKSVKQMSPA